jgi:hypothetical protein
MNIPKVSVLIPVYNGERFLAECLDSVLAQDFADMEILIADDASTDGTREIIRRFAQRDPRIRWWRNPQNLKQVGNLNRCLKEAKGDLVKFVFADDKLLSPSALQRWVEAMDADPGVTLAVSASHIVDERMALLERRNHFGQSGVLDGRRVIVRCLEENGNIIGEPTLAMFRKTAAARGFNPRFVQIVDLEMWFHLLEQGRFAYIAEPLAAFRQHAAQQTATNRRTRASDHEGLLLVEDYFPKDWLRELATPQMLFSQIYNLRKQYGAKSDPLTASMKALLKPGQYALLWLKHKVLKPVAKLKRRARMARDRRASRRAASWQP